MSAPQNFASLGPKLLLQGFEPIPVIGKGQKPDGTSGMVPGWQDVTLHRDQVAYWAANGKGHLNVGLRTGTLAAVDLDLYDPTVAARVYEAFVARFGEAPCRIGRAPKRLLVYAAEAPRTKINSAVWLRPNPEEGEKENKVEVLGIGQQFVAYGIHPDTHKPYQWLNGSLEDQELWMLPTIDLDAVAAWVREELPALIPADWTVKGSATAGAAWDDDPFEAMKNRHDDVDLEALRWMLDQLPQDYCDDRDSWRNVIFAAHHQFHGTDEELDALELVDEWSSKSVKYVTGVVPAIWENAHEQRTGGLVTVGSIKQWLGEKWKGYLAQRRSADSSAVVAEAGWRERISTADAVTLKGPLAAEIRAAKLEKIDRETLVKHVQRRLAALEGVSPSIAAVRELLAAPREVVELLDAVPDIDDWTSTAPSWARAWAWIRSEARFINRRTKRTITKEAFDTEMQRYVTDLVVQQGEHVTEFKASERMFKHWGARAVDAVLYHPAFDEFFDRDGETFINRYRPELRRSPDAAWADGGRQMARALERHLALFLPDVRERQLFRAWLAHQYLHPGVKVRWAPLLKGCPGDGKSMFGELLELVLGVDNVKLMNADTIQTSPFSGWVEGQCVTVFEEVKFHGHNRYDVVNKLKPYIANNRVEKHGKGKDPGNIFNVTNYLMLTNHEDAIPIEEGDRRYFVLFSPFRALADMDTALQADFDVTVAEHFEEVFSLVRANPGQLALWLSETEFPAEWDANMSAPMTAAKRVMVASSRTDAEQALAEILEDVATGSKVCGVGPTVVFVPHLRDEAMRRTDNRRSVGDKTVSACLREAGYLPLPGGEEGKARKVQWQGVQRSVWSKHGADISSDEVRRLLDATLADFDG
ncbi:MAG: PriCT-2 domain-containing protein [Thauera sp.]|nr:PriCT-2 domain-containing protein [Thauera sp.]